MSIVFSFLLTAALISNAPAEQVRQLQTQNVILITLDGLRWEEVFSGVERRLINKDDGGVKDVTEVGRQFLRPTAEARREILMPFFWQVIARQGQVFGSPEHKSVARVTNGHFFSYPGYNELLTGRADSRIDSNDKRPNPNVTVLEWLHRLPEYRGRIAAFCSWDVFPYIINTQRSGIPVNAGWQPLSGWSKQKERFEWLNEVGDEIPHVWPSVRYDVFTFRGAVHYLQEFKPRLLYVALGETDDWAHEGRYDLYLDAARRNDRYVEQLWLAAQAIDQYAGKTSLVLTTDHGRGHTRTGWKSHGQDYPGSDRIWIAVMGPDTAPLGLRTDNEVTLGQVAATVAALLGEDFRIAASGTAPPLPGVIRQVSSP